MLNLFIQRVSRAFKKLGLHFCNGIIEWLFSKGILCRLKWKNRGQPFLFLSFADFKCSRCLAFRV